MDVLAAVLAREKKAAELEALALKLIDQAGETHCQPWVAMGYHHLLSRKLTRALYLAHKVLPVPFFFSSQFFFARRHNPQGLSLSRSLVCLLLVILGPLMDLSFIHIDVDCLPGFSFCTATVYFILFFFCVACKLL